jgi:tetratricopeptide (TPR) repeat protein
MGFARPSASERGLRPAALRTKRALVSTVRVRRATAANRRPMARADPKGSAEAAIRHLFRYLGNAEELRRNPLASSLFDDASRTDQDDAVAIERLRWFIAEAAARFAMSACNAGSLARERRARQERMVIRCGLEGASSKQVAAEFGLSKSRFYREYGEVCTEIARALQARAAAANAVRLIFDRAAFQLERAGAQAEAGDYDSALRTYDGLLRSGPVSKLRVEAICRQVELELERGNYAAARRALDDAVEITATANGQLTDAKVAASKARLALLHSKLAWATADFGPAAKLLEAAQRSLKPFLGRPNEATTLSLIDTLLERGDRERHYGDFRAAMACVQQVRALARTSTILSPQRQVDTTLLEAQLTRDTAGLGGTYTPARYAALLNSALDTAKAVRSLRRMIEVEVEFTDPFFHANRTTSALDTAQLLISKARQFGNTRLLAYVALYMADWLGTTSSWAAVPVVLRDALGIETEGSGAWTHMALLLSIYYSKVGELTQARYWAERAFKAAQRSGNERHAAGALRCLAAAASRQRDRDAAAEYICAALPIAERTASAEARILTYRVAQAVTGERRYGRAADELSRAIAAG